MGHQNNNAIKKRETESIFGVEYTHLKFDNGDDLYITKEGMPFADNLMPYNFLTDKAWFSENSIKLAGTSYPYKVRTKTVKGKHADVVVKWNRMGQEIPGSEDSEELLSAEFNSPFEEFSPVMELKSSLYNSKEKTEVQKPLAIYVPKDPVELWETGRKAYKTQYKIDSHKEIALDMFRPYAVIFEWIPGIDASEAFTEKLMSEEEMKLITLESRALLGKNGFMVRDSKPNHIIVKPRGKTLEKDEAGNVSYSLIDFELLEMTPQHEKKIKKDKRAEYLKRQRDRFKIELPTALPPNLSHTNIFGVDYIYGNVESTKGRLWVVGKDPRLFEYFLPEKWEKISKTMISLYNEMHHTVTKDNINLVWKASKVGLQPDMDPFKEDEKKILEYGYNSPFEEVATAISLSRKGIATIYPRAIYMTSSKTEISKILFDGSRYESHKDIMTPDGLPILTKNRDYILIWGYWNGPDEKLAANDGDYYEGIDAIHAYREGIITKEQYFSLLHTAKEKLLQAGVEDLNFRGNHLLVSLDKDRKLITNEEGKIEIRVCSFEFLKKV